MKVDAVKPAPHQRINLLVNECNGDVTPIECPEADFTAYAPIIVEVNHPLKSVQRTQPLRVLSAVVVAVLSVVLIAWFLGGKSIVEKAVHNRTQPWAVFQVPETAVPLTGLEATLTGNVVTICNRSNDAWSKVLVQIDEDYLAELDHLQIGSCKQLNVFEDFTTESWKRMPPPRDLHVTRVAVLANVDEKRYARKSLIR
jgi:hypothetical protein